MLQDEDYERCIQRIEAEKRTEGLPENFGLDGDGRDVGGRFQSLNAFLETQDYPCIRDSLEEKRNAGKEALSVYEFGVLALALALTRRPCEPEAQHTLAISSLISPAYAALSLSASAQGRHFEAHRLMNLARLCCAKPEARWYQYACSRMCYNNRRSTCAVDLV